MQGAQQHCACGTQQDLRDQAFSWATSGRYQEAIGAFKQLVTVSPDDAELHEALAQCLMEGVESDADAACEAALQATHISPNVRHMSKCSGNKVYWMP
jgi:Flp pilus assembly protein TadD